MAVAIQLLTQASGLLRRNASTLACWRFARASLVTQEVSLWSTTICATVMCRRAVRKRIQPGLLPLRFMRLRVVVLAISFVFRLLFVTALWLSLLLSSR